MGRQRFAAPMRSRATMTICFQLLMDQIMKPKLSIYLSDHVAERSRWQPGRPGTNSRDRFDAALDRFLNPERDQTADAAWCGVSTA